MKPTDNHEAFELAIALYDWLSHWYGGMGCDKYVAMCRMTGQYGLNNRACIDYDSTEYDEDEMVRMYYHDLTEDNWEQTFEAWCEYMDTQWDLEAC